MVEFSTMRLAVIGLGFMGSTHLKAYKNVPAAKLTAVVSNDERQLSGDLSGIQGNIGGPGEKYDFSEVKKYRDPGEALRDPDIDVVDICLPTDFHASVAIDALRNGKHVLVEKPMALTPEDTDAMLAEARKNNRILMVGQVLRFVSSYRTVHDKIKGGEVGPVRSALFRRRCAAPFWSTWLFNPQKSGGGIFDLLIHDVDYCLQVFGAPEAVSAIGYEDLPAGIDWINAQFHYPKVPAVIINGGWHHPKSYPFSMEFTVVTDGGTFEYSSDAKPLTLYDKNGESQKLLDTEVDCFQAEIEYFFDCVTQGKQPEFCPPEESARAVKLARLMVDSRTRNGEKIPCNL